MAMPARPTRPSLRSLLQDDHVIDRSETAFAGGVTFMIDRQRPPKPPEEEEEEKQEQQGGR